jgi:hypothetical protein
MSPRILAVTALLLASFAAGPARARDETSLIAIAASESVESCVDTTTIRFGKAEPHAVLDETDTAAVGAALIARYPMISQDGFEPSGLVLWRKPETGWLYIALLANPAKPAQVCFTATFAAGRFDLTGPLLKKYFDISETKT